MIPALFHISQADFERVQSMHDQLVRYLGNLLHRDRPIGIHPALINGYDAAHNVGKVELQQGVRNLRKQHVALNQLDLKRFEHARKQLVRREGLATAHRIDKFGAHHLVGDVEELADGNVDLHVGRRRGKRVLHNVQDLVHTLFCQRVQKAVDGAKMHVERFAIDIGLASNRGDGDLVELLLLKEPIKGLDDGLAAAQDATIDMLCVSTHGPPQDGRCGIHHSAFTFVAYTY